jgi:hypothetical protein
LGTYTGRNFRVPGAAIDRTASPPRALQHYLVSGLTAAP